MNPIDAKSFLLATVQRPWGWWDKPAQSPEMQAAQRVMRYITDAKYPREMENLEWIAEHVLSNKSLRGGIEVSPSFEVFIRVWRDQEGPEHSFTGIVGVIKQDGVHYYHRKFQP